MARNADRLKFELEYGTDLTLSISNAPAQIVKRDKWIPDGPDDRCAICNSEFSLFHRRHHCRRCGRIFCADCMATGVLVGGQAMLDKVCCLCMSLLNPREVKLIADIPRFKHLLTCPDGVLVLETIRFLRNSQINDNNRQTLSSNEDVLSSIVLILKKSIIATSRDPSTGQYSDEARKIGRGYGGFRPVQQLLIQAVGLCINFTSSIRREFSQQLVRLGIVPVISSLLVGDRDEVMQEMALWLLRNLSVSPECIKHIVHPQPGSLIPDVPRHSCPLEAICSLLSSHVGNIQEFGCSLLANIAKTCPPETIPIIISFNNPVMLCCDMVHHTKTDAVREKALRCACAIAARSKEGGIQFVNGGMLRVVVTTAGINVASSSTKLTGTASAAASAAAREMMMGLSALCGLTEFLNNSAGCPDEVWQWGVKRTSSAGAGASAGAGDEEGGEEKEETASTDVPETCCEWDLKAVSLPSSTAILSSSIVLAFVFNKQFVGKIVSILSCRSAIAVGKALTFLEVIMRRCPTFLCEVIEHEREDFKRAFGQILRADRNRVFSGVVNEFVKNVSKYSAESDQPGAKGWLERELDAMRPQQREYGAYRQQPTHGAPPHHGGYSQQQPAPPQRQDFPGTEAPPSYVQHAQQHYGPDSPALPMPAHQGGQPHPQPQYSQAPSHPSSSSTGYSQPPPSQGYSQPPPSHQGYASSAPTQPKPQPVAKPSTSKYGVPKFVQQAQQKQRQQQQAQARYSSQGYSQPPPSQGYSQPPPVTSHQPPSQGYSQPPPSQGYSQPPHPAQSGYSAYSSDVGYGVVGSGDLPPSSSSVSTPSQPIQSPPPSSQPRQQPPSASSYSSGKISVKSGDATSFNPLL
ncbi:hypothetical protein ADUPG1_011436 [Aduncisulcus paluster]|uniref:FYVE-type domain-containing protein n=1 Tax=Aduncisulcus paluster TaxID=2918883 RepID=A0ABQ5JVM1_9EUKA|nr:hypothetical protein ADUPG1_011436 [Aduncisulcus paluster]|eukprot:gnl/Carplike_NY0171/878_a1208_1121.p1 GENE.gnl/Carplike_NY0171/878_a1208_1121~~gnl/Carplike_NY0171/878_a1208_1121.p1  ORF type:complete len:860 (+),score=301.90 gnl/Carplike_NY0171/878_a1208_1121:15-2594(+)